jgi:hypothetical protein
MLGSLPERYRETREGRHAELTTATNWPTLFPLTKAASDSTSARLTLPAILLARAP